MENTIESYGSITPKARPYVFFSPQMTKDEGRKDKCAWGSQSPSGTSLLVLFLQHLDVLSTAFISLVDIHTSW